MNKELVLEKQSSNYHSVIGYVNSKIQVNFMLKRTEAETCPDKCFVKCHNKGYSKQYFFKYYSK